MLLVDCCVLLGTVGSFRNVLSYGTSVECSLLIVVFSSALLVPFEMSWCAGRGLNAVVYSIVGCGIGGFLFGMSWIFVTLIVLRCSRSWFVFLLECLAWTDDRCSLVLLLATESRYQKRLSRGGVSSV